MNLAARLLALGLAVSVAAAPAVRAAPTERWLKASYPEFTVVTTLNPKEAEAWAREFAQFLAALRAFFGDNRRPLPALTIVVFARERDFRAYHPKFDADGKPQAVDGFFSRHESWSVAGLRARVSDETRRIIFHEGLHWYLSTTRTRNPVWLEEGLAEVFSTFRVDGNHAEWGRAIEAHVLELRLRKPLPLERLLFTAQGEVFGNDRVRTGLVYAQSWAFVHFLVFGKHEIPRRGIEDYIEAISAGRNLDKAFRESFGRSYAEMDQVLQRYLDGGSYYVRRQPLSPVAPPTVGPAAAFEVEDALGRLAFAGRNWQLAATHGRAAIAAAPPDPRGHELLAIALDEQGDAEGARAEFAAAVERGTKDFQPHFELAEAAQNRAVAEGQLAAQEARQIANGYQRAINLYPRFRPAFENLAGVVGVVEPWGEEDRKFLEFGLRLFPNSAMIQVGLAQLSRRGGDKAAAQALLEKVLAEPALPTEVAQFARKIDAAWEQQDIAAEIEELTQAKRFSEALDYLDRRLEGGVAPTNRMHLGVMRKQLRLAQQQQAVKEALDARRWREARAALETLLAGEAPAGVQAYARRTLTELDRRNLGRGENGEDAPHK